MLTAMKTSLLLLALILIALPACAGERLEKWRETREHRQQGKELMNQKPTGVIFDSFEQREILVHVAPNAREKNRALVVVLHGGMGNANHIHGTIGKVMNDAADEGGFIVAYLNGSGATRLGENGHNAWNAGGGCCGQPFKNNVDDIGYITRAIDYLAAKYSIDKKQVFGMGHSNGAIMTQTLMCKTDLFQAAIPISGPLQIDAQSCPRAYHKRVLAIHGVLDENVPIGGGNGTKGVTNIEYKSQSYSKGAFEESSAVYTIDAVEGADHSLANIRDIMFKRDERTLGQSAALFFGLAPKY